MVWFFFLLRAVLLMDVAVKLVGITGVRVVRRQVMWRKCVNGSLQSLGLEKGVWMDEYGVWRFGSVLFLTLLPPLHLTEYLGGRIKFF